MPFKAKYDWEEELPAIKILGAAGNTMADVARHYGVSRQRMKQVIDRLIPNWEDLYGRAVTRAQKAAAAQAKWGIGGREATDLYTEQRSKFRRKKCLAKRIGWEWDIDFGDVDWPTHCPILGMELDYFAESVAENSPSFDRIDSSKGYVRGNVHVVSWRANRIKNNGTAEEHRRIADYLDSLEQS